jgi:surface antigen
MTLGRQQYWAETPYDTRALDFDSLALAVEPAERVGAPLPNQFKSGLWRLLLATLLVGGYWAAVAHFGVHGLLASATSLYATVVSQAQDIASRAHQQGSASSGVGAAGLASPDAPGSQITQAPATNVVSELPPAQDEKAASADEPPSTESMGEAYAEKAEPAEDAKDNSPKRKSAVAAGLGPDLPNVLLARLSAADLKNAAYAIKTALAKTPDDAQFAWPPKPSRQQALFEIRFVQGAGQGCRRYIVTVTKDRWSSTSAALEKCGSVHAHAS